MKTIFGAVIWNPYRSKRPRGFYNLLRGHSGVDLNYVFEELPSPVSGKIDKITKQPEMGNVIYLSDIEQGAIHVFAHMSKINVDVGQHIKVGDVLGVTGNSGSRTTSPHLHYEVITFMHARLLDDGLISVDMGAPRLGWQDIPLAREMDTLRLDYEMGGYREPTAVSMGNPHVVFFVEDVEKVDLRGLGPRIEHDPLFPERTNVQFVERLPDGALRHRIWERGAGATHASGSSACAVIVAAVRRGIIEGRSALLHQPGGTLRMEWREDNGHVQMTGPASEVFTGELNASLLELAE